MVFAWRLGTEDLRALLLSRCVRPLLLSAFLTGILSGQGRFLSAYVERRHRVPPSRIGLVLGPVLGTSGVLSGFLVGHGIDRCHQRHGLTVNLPLGHRPRA